MVNNYNPNLSLVKYQVEHRVQLIYDKLDRVQNDVLYVPPFLQQEFTSGRIMPNTYNSFPSPYRTDSLVGVIFNNRGVFSPVVRYVHRRLPDFTFDLPLDTLSQYCLQLESTSPYYAAMYTGLKILPYARAHANMSIYLKKLFYPLILMQLIQILFKFLVLRLL